MNQFPRDHLRRMNEDPAPDNWIIPVLFVCMAIGLCSIIATIYLGLTP